MLAASGRTRRVTRDNSVTPKRNETLAREHFSLKQKPRASTRKDVLSVENDESMEKSRQSGARLVSGPTQKGVRVTTDYDHTEVVTESSLSALPSLSNSANNSVRGDITKYEEVDIVQHFDQVVKDAPKKNVLDAEDGGAKNPGIDPDDDATTEEEDWSMLPVTPAAKGREKRSHDTRSGEKMVKNIPITPRANAARSRAAKKHSKSAEYPRGTVRLNPTIEKIAGQKRKNPCRRNEAEPVEAESSVELSPLPEGLTLAPTAFNRSPVKHRPGNAGTK